MLIAVDQRARISAPGSFSTEEHEEMKTYGPARCRRRGSTDMIHAGSQFLSDKLFKSCQCISRLIRQKIRSGD